MLSELGWSTSISHFYFDQKAHGSDEANQYKCSVRSLLVTVLLCLNSRGCFHTAQHDSRQSTHCHTLLGVLVLPLDTRGREGLASDCQILAAPAVIRAIMFFGLSVHPSIPFLPTQYFKNAFGRSSRIYTITITLYTNKCTVTSFYSVKNVQAVIQCLSSGGATWLGHRSI